VSRQVILDTGPLVALLNRRDTYHQWAKAQFALIEPPLATCEAVISEACFLLRTVHPGPRVVLDLLARGVVHIPFRLADEADPIRQLLQKYASVPMALADACLVRMSEQNAHASVITLDDDFRIYRKAGRRSIPTIMPTVAGR
jgi:predicted nucleic acid-binding protein